MKVIVALEFQFYHTANRLALFWVVDNLLCFSSSGRSADRDCSFGKFAEAVSAVVVVVVVVVMVVMVVVAMGVVEVAMAIAAGSGSSSSGCSSS